MIGLRVGVQIGVVFNLDKCIGCNTCTVACKNLWTNRDGCEYMWWNNVEYKPGTGYPRQWENQDRYRGGWVKKNGDLKLRIGGKLSILLNIFWNPYLPRMEDYMGKHGPWTYTYEDLHTNIPMTQTPVARPKSMISGEEDIELEWGVNWEDEGAGINKTALEDVNFQKLSPEEREAYLQYEHVFYFFVPRICNHCLNPGCVAACPAGAIYKREEDGIVLIAQDKCRGWRFCISGCPYKKVYFNWNTGKSEKCILCYPKIEHGLPPQCMHACVGKIRYVGVVLYDMDRVYEAASAPDKELVRAHRDIILDPFDEEVVSAARAAGVPESWIEAARKSPFYFFVKKWEVALPLHPEFRTLPMVWYIPPLSPMKTVVKDGVFDVSGEWLPELDDFRIPIKYLANLLAAGNIAEVEKALRRLIAVRKYRRSVNVDGEADASILEEVGLTVEDAEHMYRLLALAFFNERFVIPTTHREKVVEPYVEQGFRGFYEKMVKRIWHKEPLRDYPPDLGR